MIFTFERNISRKRKSNLLTRPESGEEREFKYFAWFPKLFHALRSNEMMIIWLESYTVTATYHRAKKQKWDYWGKGRLDYKDKKFIEQ